MLPQTCWIVVESGLTGTENQCRGVTDSLGIAPEIKRIGLKQPWKSLSPWLGFERECAFTGDPLAAPWPGLVIAGGRKAVAALRYIKKRNPQTFAVFLQNPRIHPKAFDLVAVPAHDGRHGDNVVVTRATPNRITPALLAEEKIRFAPLFEPLPAPRVAVLIGGNSKHHRLTPVIAARIAEQLSALSDKGFSLMTTASRRTGEENAKIIRNALPPSTFFWDGSGDNPYPGMLAWADTILVTSDSASMISEAATTGKPVYLIELEGGSKRLDRLRDNLLRDGIVRLFDGTLEPYGYTPLADAARVANKIRKSITEQIQN